MNERIKAAAAILALPESWGLVLAAIGTYRRGWMTAAEMAEPSRADRIAGLPGVDPEPCAAMAEMGAAGPGATWLDRWEISGPADPDAGDVPPPGSVAWTLSTWAAEALGLELIEVGTDGAPARWVEIRYDPRGRRLACDRPIVTPWHRWERLQPWIERLSEDRRKALMASGPRVVETLKDEESGREIRLFAGPEGKGAGVAIVRELKRLGQTIRGKGKGKVKRMGKSG